MISSLIDINEIPINVAILKYEKDDFILYDCNKHIEKYKELSKELLIGKKIGEICSLFQQKNYFNLLLRVYESGRQESFYASLDNISSKISLTNNKIIRLADNTLALFYENIPLNLSQNMIFENISKNSETISVQGYNKNHEVIYWNRGSEILYGYSEAQATGKKLEDLIIPNEMKEIVHNAIEAWLYEDIPIPASELILKAKDGSDVNVYSSHVMVNTSEDETTMYCIDINLHEIKHLERKLTIQENFLHTIFNIIPDLVWIKDLNGKYLKCNPRFEQFYGAKEEAILGHTDYDFVDKELADFFRKNDLLALKSETPRVNEEYLTFADGSHEGMFETIKTVMYKDNGEILGVLGIARDIQDRKTKEKELEKGAHYDNLTKLTNRVLFMDKLHALLKEHSTTKQKHAILFIDLDSFKEINDTIGHEAGDKVLQETAKRLLNSVRQGDTVSRLGGDEFTILLENIHSLDDAKNIATKIVSTLGEPFSYHKKTIHISASVGISIYPDDTLLASDLLRYADKAMYRAKTNLKNRYEFYTH